MSAFLPLWGGMDTTKSKGQAPPEAEPVLLEAQLIVCPSVWSPASRLSGELRFCSPSRLPRRLHSHPIHASTLGQIFSVCPEHAASVVTGPDFGSIISLEELLRGAPRKRMTVVLLQSPPHIALPTAAEALAGWQPGTWVAPILNSTRTNIREVSRRADSTNTTARCVLRAWSGEGGTAFWVVPFPTPATSALVGDPRPAPTGYHVRDKDHCRPLPPYHGWAAGRGTISARNMASYAVWSGACLVQITELWRCLQTSAPISNRGPPAKPGLSGSNLSAALTLRGRNLFSAAIAADCLVWGQGSNILERLESVKQDMLGVAASPQSFRLLTVYMEPHPSDKDAFNIAVEIIPQGASALCPPYLRVWGWMLLSDLLLGASSSDAARIDLPSTAWDVASILLQAWLATGSPPPTVTVQGVEIDEATVWNLCDEKGVQYAEAHCGPGVEWDCFRPPLHLPRLDSAGVEPDSPAISILFPLPHNPLKRPAVSPCSPSAAAQTVKRSRAGEEPLESSVSMDLEIDSDRSSNPPRSLPGCCCGTCGSSCVCSGRCSPGICSCRCRAPTASSGVGPHGGGGRTPCNCERGCPSSCACQCHPGRRPNSGRAGGWESSYGLYPSPLDPPCQIRTGPEDGPFGRLRRGGFPTSRPQRPRAPPRFCTSRRECSRLCPWFSRAYKGVCGLRSEEAVNYTRSPSLAVPPELAHPVVSFMLAMGEGVNEVKTSWRLTAPVLHRIVQAAGRWVALFPPPCPQPMQRGESVLGCFTGCPWSSSRYLNPCKRREHHDKVALLRHYILACLSTQRLERTVRRLDTWLPPITPGLKTWASERWRLPLVQSLEAWLLSLFHFPFRPGSPTVAPWQGVAAFTSGPAPWPSLSAKALPWPPAGGEREIHWSAHGLDPVRKDDLRHLLITGKATPSFFLFSLRMDAELAGAACWSTTWCLSTPGLRELFSWARGRFKREKLRRMGLRHTRASRCPFRGVDNYSCGCPSVLDLASLAIHGQRLADTSAAGSPGSHPLEERLNNSLGSRGDPDRIDWAAREKWMSWIRMSPAPGALGLWPTRWPEVPVDGAIRWIVSPLVEGGNCACPPPPRSVRHRPSRSTRCLPTPRGGPFGPQSSHPASVSGTLSLPSA